jgi:uncharacterized membrane protein
MVAASAFLVTFRIIHIVAGVAWAGSLFLFVVFIQPSSAAIGPAAGPFMQELLVKRRLPDRILALAGVTILGGLVLYWHDWQAYPSFADWIDTRFGLVMTIGGLLAIATAAIGLFGTRPTVGRFMALNRRAAEAVGPPPPELADEIQKTGALLRTLARTSLALLTLSVIAMATARYW